MTRAAAGPGALVLIADDEPDLRATLRDVLTDRGFRTLEAADGQAALDLAEAEHPDLIVMDVMMRGMDGYTALTALAANPATRHIPVVIMTAEQGPVYRTLSAGVGAAAHISKPFDPERLPVLLRSILARSSVEGA